MRVKSVMTHTYLDDGKVRILQLGMHAYNQLGRILFCYHTEITVSIALIMMSLRAQR